MVDMADPQDLASWLAQLQDAVADLERAAVDQLRPLGARELGRVSAAAIVAESADKIAQLIDAARRSVGYADPAGNGGAGDVN